MTETIDVFAADGPPGKVVPVVVRIVEPIPASHILTRPERVSEVFRAQGEALAEALWGALPGGTVDCLLAGLLARRASEYRRPFEPAPRPLIVGRSPLSPRGRTVDPFEEEGDRG